MDICHVDDVDENKLILFSKACGNIKIFINLLSDFEFISKLTHKLFTPSFQFSAEALHIYSSLPQFSEATLKQSLDRTLSLTDVEVGKTLVGFVYKKLEHGLFICFNKKLFGLAVNECLPDPIPGFGQTVKCKVIEMKNNRFLVDLRLSSEPLSFLRSFLENWEEFIPRSGRLKKIITSKPLGSTLVTTGGFLISNEMILTCSDSSHVVCQKSNDGHFSNNFAVVSYSLSPKRAVVTPLFVPVNSVPEISESLLEAAVLHSCCDFTLVQLLVSGVVCFTSSRASQNHGSDLIDRGKMVLVKIAEFGKYNIAVIDEVLEKSISLYSLNEFAKNSTDISHVLDDHSNSEESSSQSEPELETNDILKEVELSIENFENLVAATPDDVKAWIAYCDFLVSRGYLDQARKVLERALNNINYRHEDSKLEIWLILLKLDLEHGSEDDYATTIARVIRNNNETKFFKKWLTYLATRTDSFLFYSTLDRSLKRCKGDFAFYKFVFKCLFQQKDFSRAKKVFDSALRQLQNKDQVMLIVAYASLEFQYGEPERGRTMFENLLSTYNTRVDIWSVYIDMVMKYMNTRSVEVARQIYTSFDALTLPSKKRRPLLSKWLAFEKLNGNQMQLQFVQNKLDVL